MKKQDLISKDGKIHMWTAQSAAVYDAVKRDGFSVVKKEYIDKKYGESAWIFNDVYSSFREEAEKKGFLPEHSAYSPVWLFRDKMWLFADSGSVVLKLAVAPEKLILFDREKWNRALNLAYIGETRDEEDRFAEELSAMGIREGVDLFRQPYYPLQRDKIKKSRKRIFDIGETKEEDIQGAVWALYAEDITDVTFIG